MAQQIKKKYIEDGAIDGDKLKLLVGQAIVQETALGVVELLKQQEADGKFLIGGQEVGFKSDLDEEITARIAGDSALQGNIDSEAETRNLADQQLQSDLNSESSARSAADVVLQGNIDAEASARVSADNTLQSNIDGEAFAREGADNTLQSNIDSEESSRIAGDASLQSQINDIISNVDPLALDSLSEIVSAFQEADSDLNDAITSVLGTHTSELATETSARQSADSTLQANIDSEESSRISGDANLQSQVDSLVSAKDDMQDELDATQAGVGLESDGSYVPNGLSNYIALTSSVKEAVETLDSTLKSESDARVAAVAQEASDRQSGDDEIKGLLDGLESYTTIKDLNDAVVAEESTRASADSTLQSNIDAEASARSFEDAILQGNIDSEESARIAGDASLQSQINDIISNVDPLALDSLSEIVTAFQDADSDLNDAITAVLGTHTSELASETSARESADSALSGRLDVVEAYEFKKEKMVLSSTDILNGYVDLGFEARPFSIRAFVGRLAMHEGSGEDYTVSVVGGVTRVTFVGNMVSPSEEQLVEGDVLHFSYEK